MIIFKSKWLIELITGAKDKAHDQAISALKEARDIEVKVFRVENERLRIQIEQERARADASVDRLLEHIARVQGIRHASLEKETAAGLKSIPEEDVAREMTRIGSEMNSMGEDEGHDDMSSIVDIGGAKMSPVLSKS